MISPLRLDRCLTLSIFRTLKRLDSKGTVRRVPILMYHSISDEPEAGVRPYYRLTTHPRRFAEQMQWLNQRGYWGVSLELALAMLADGEADNWPLVVITFDDGYRDFYTEAWPVLQRHSFAATVFLPTALVGSQRKSFRGRECLTWSEVRDLHAQGVRFGSHTVSHPKLHELPWNRIEDELRFSRQSLEQELGEKIYSFAYPYAFPQEDRRFTARFAALLRAQGYRSCVTTRIGRARMDEDLFSLRRLPVNSGDDEALFIAKLQGAYDWMSVVQNAFRFGKVWAKRTPPRVPATDADAYRELIQP
jgi:peptidoglycan/xylan/chitin deacetylase (PgdA/CDA1 family)